MPRPAFSRFGRLGSRRPAVVSERDWERSAVLEARPVLRHPELISDGGGLPFAPGALSSSPGQLDPADPAVAVLVAQIHRSASKAASRGKGEQGAAPTLPSLDGWRLLARGDDEVLFGRGRPPQLVTVAVRRDRRRDTWTCMAVSNARPLRTVRDGLRASGWRLDPTSEVDPGEATIRVLVTEQTWSGGARADGRVLPPDLYVGADELVLTMYVTPRQGFQMRTPNPETPARIVLPDAVGSRQLVDGAIYDGAPGGERAPV
ncbi:MAG: hypothetical protein ACLP50_35305 [Solirubrobacteraceae bacterium]